MLLRKTLIAGIALASLLSGVVWAGEATKAKAWERAETLLHFHNEEDLADSDLDGEQILDRPCPDEFETPSVRDCAGLVDSWDGISLSTSMLIPKDAAAPLPTILFLHAYGSNRGEFRLAWPAGFNASSFAERGYAVIMPSARGMGGSCSHGGPATGTHFESHHQPQVETPHGPPPPGWNPDAGPDFTCSRGWTHVADRDYEIKDWQYLLGKLVDLKVADPDRLVVIGSSYGAGQAWLLAASMPWSTPSGDRTIQLAAAVSHAGWTSMQNSIAPNGRATDEPGGGRSLEMPFGILKQEGAVAVTALFPTIRFNEVEPGETHSYRPGAFALWERGEPYDGPEIARLSAAYRNKSALFAEDYFAALSAGKVKPVPILAVQGWNDAAMTPVEALQMYRKLKAADLEYPIHLFLANIGHVPGFEATADAAFHAHASRFVEAYALNAGEGAPSPVVSMSTECPPDSNAGVFRPPAPSTDTVRGTGWDSVRAGHLTMRSDRPLTTSSGPLNATEEAWTQQGARRCVTQPPFAYTAVDDYTWDVPDGGLTLLGLPKLIADYELSGVDASVIAKLWDRAPDGRRVLVTRGLYRLALAGGDAPTGKLKFQLFGNHYRFQEGHTIQLELSQTDVPYLRPNNLPSSVSYTGVKLELPLRAQD